METLTSARTPGSTLHNVLTELAGDDATRSEATTLHALVTLGKRVIQDRALENGYAAWAATTTGDDRAEQQALRNRHRRPSQTDLAEDAEGINYDQYGKD
jgi:hypothetical protein